MSLNVPSYFVDRFTKVRTTNDAATSFSTLDVTATEPAGAGVFDVVKWADNEFIQTQLVSAIPFGTNAANEAFAMRITGWSYFDGVLWVPTILYELTCTLGARTGVSGNASLPNTQFLCDTIVKVSGDDDFLQIDSPTGDLIANATFHTRGHPKLQFQFNNNTSTDANALVRRL